MDILFIFYRLSIKFQTPRILIILFDTVIDFNFLILWTDVGQRILYKFKQRSVKGQIMEKCPRRRIIILQGE